MTDEYETAQSIRARIYEIEHQPIITAAEEDELQRLYAKLERIMLQGGEG